MTPPPRPLGRGLMILLAVSVFAGAGTIHYQTPMLAAFASEFAAGPAAAGWVATLSFGGFLLGTILFVPLGDRVDKRRLILAELSVLIVALIAMAAAPSLALLAGAAFAVGVSASFPQLMIPLAAELAPSESRGRVLGTILACLFLGILFARLAGGFAASYIGWRWVYVIAATMLAALMPALLLRLPHSRPRTQLGYGALIASLVALLRANATLRRASGIQFLLGISYGGICATAAPILPQPPRVRAAAKGVNANPRPGRLPPAPPPGAL